MTKQPRLIEVAFPLKQASLDSVHEKNVRHGHISTLHIWPARRPLAACRAALIATLLPDPGTPEDRQRLLEKIGGKVVQRIEKKKVNGKVVEKVRDETAGGVLHWGRESSTDMDWFRSEIRKAYGGRAPRVLDPFAGGGAIPLEAMRLGCETKAIDINPVAWLLLRGTLEYPQKLAGQKLPLPAFVRQDLEFMEAFFKAQGYKGARLRGQLNKYGLGANGEPMLSGMDTLHPEEELNADLSWHVRAWGMWVLNAARKELAGFYPTYAEFQPLSKDVKDWPTRDARVMLLKVDGTLDLDGLNSEFDEKYLAEKNNPRWVPKPAVAYLWARTVKCKNCRAIIPLLKTRWLCKKDNKRVLLIIEPNADKTGVVFRVQDRTPRVGGNAAQSREHDKRIGAGTMTRSGAICPCCNVISTAENIRLEGQAGQLGAILTTVVEDGLFGKSYRLPTALEIQAALDAGNEIEHVFEHIPFGVPNEPIPQGASRAGGGSPFTVHIYGMTHWQDLFTRRQLLALGTLVKWTRVVRSEMQKRVDSQVWLEAVTAYLTLALSRMSDRSSTICHWSIGFEKIQNTFSRFALAMSWDYSESNPLSSSSGTYDSQIDWIAKVVEHCENAYASGGQLCETRSMSSIGISESHKWDIVVTDPPYYDAIPYSDLMDFFYVWQRRTLFGLSPDVDDAFRNPLAPKWNHETHDGELIDDSSRFGGDKEKSKSTYEVGMTRVFQACFGALTSEGRLVIVFAHKNPNAWETLVSAIIRTGFVVDASWPIQTEMSNRTRALTSAALSSSVWLVCKKRRENARPGWDQQVLDQMRTNIHTKLREYWDVGIRGPDFVWAATGPALEAYSQHPVVKKANAPNEMMSVSEFLKEVRRIVVDFVVGRVLSHNGYTEAAIGLDDVTTYYLLHRHDFGLADAPIGACILYALSCNLSDSALVSQYDLLIHSGGRAEAEAEAEDESDDDLSAGDDGDAEGEETEGTASKVRLRSWNQRRRAGMGYDPSVDSPRARKVALNPPLSPEFEQPVPKPRAVPLIDQAHRLMHLWKAGDVVKVNEYLDQRALRKNGLFLQLLQALIELAPTTSEERSLLESISNHLVARGIAPDARQFTFLRQEADTNNE